MSVFDETIAAFGRQLGIDGLEPDAAGVVSLEIERTGLVQLQKTGDQVLATLARDWPPQSEGLAEKLLGLCHWRENHPWLLNPGMLGESKLCLTATLAENSFTPQEMDALLAYLAEALDGLEA